MFQPAFQLGVWIFSFLPGTFLYRMLVKEGSRGRAYDAGTGRFVGRYHQIGAFLLTALLSTLIEPFFEGILSQVCSTQPYLEFLLLIITAVIFVATWK